MPESVTDAGHRLGCVGVLGLGHMGASLAGALATRVPVLGFDSDARAIAYVTGTFGVRGAQSLQELVTQCSVIMIASPTPEVPALRAELDALAELVGTRPVVCDIASVKVDLGLGSQRDLALRFVSLHPMAGREGNGAMSADPAIFARANWVVVLTGCEEPEALLMAISIPLALGNGVVPMWLAQHDEAIALVSTLPHVSAAALARAVGTSEDRDLLSLLAAGSIRDGVRVARTDPHRIVEMVYPNRSALRPAIDALIDELLACRDHLDDVVWLSEWMGQAHLNASALAREVGEVTHKHVALEALGDELGRLASAHRLVVGLDWEATQLRVDSVGYESSRDSAT